MTIQQVGQLVFVIVSAYLGTTLLGSESIKGRLAGLLSTVRKSLGVITTNSNRDLISDETSHSCTHKLIDVATALRKAGAFDLAREVDSLLGEVNEALSMSKIASVEVSSDLKDKGQL